MHIVILGAGAVGGYFGGRLALGGSSVTFLVREKRFYQLKERGLRVHSVHGDFTITPHLVQSPEEADSVDLVIVAIKNYHLPAALDQIAALVDQGAKILPLLNGIEHMDTLLRAFGPKTVLGGACYVEATLDENGDIVQTSQMHDVIFGPVGDLEPTWIQRVAQEFRRAAVNVSVSPSIMVEMWKKYLFLNTFSAMTAGTRKPIGDVLNDEVALEFLKGLVKEAVSVAKAQEPSLPEDTMDQIMRRFYSIAPGMTSSLHRDLEKGLPLELDSLQGAMIRMGGQHGLDMPKMAAVFALLHPYSVGAGKVTP